MGSGALSRYRVGMARPREFDVDQAIERALHLFWAKGYEGTTLTDLTDTLGISRPSLYAAFGSKEELFQRALERYATGASAAVRAALEAPTAREAAYAVLRFHADAAGRADVPRGCLLVQGALACSEETEPVRAALAEQRRAGELATRARFEKAQRAGELGHDAKPADLARWVWTVCHGLAVQAASGATREQLRRVVEVAMTGWPAAPERAQF